MAKSGKRKNTTTTEKNILFPIKFDVKSFTTFSTHYGLERKRCDINYILLVEKMIPGENENPKMSWSNIRRTEHQINS